MAARLSPTQRERELAEVLAMGWKMAGERDALEYSFKFANFNQAFGWMTRIALFAEKLDHHPEWSNVYNRVEVVLTTHSVDGLTMLDIKMAKMMMMAAKE